jgi:hypothetical protein
MLHAGSSGASWTACWILCWSLRLGMIMQNVLAHCQDGSLAYTCCAGVRAVACALLCQQDGPHSKLAPSKSF